MDTLRESIATGDYTLDGYKVLPESKVKYSGSKCKLNFDVKHPEQYVSQIAESKDFSRLTQQSSTNEILSTNSNMTINLASLQLKLYKTGEILRALRRRKSRHYDTIAEQWEKLEEDEEKLRDNFILFNNFTKENNEKRLRSEKKIRENTELIQSRQDEINAYSKLIDKIDTVHKEILKRLRRGRVYEDFLTNVIECYPEFCTICDVVRRYIALIETKMFLSTRLRNAMDTLEQAHEFMVKNSIWNVYVHMAASKKHPIKIKKEKVEEQIMYLNRTLTELAKINRMIKKKVVKGR
ncbi:coiled-coil domain-containing protein 42 like-2-like isoform X4 [Sitophilus oryzae]|uniref:Coiled-coil domain-containing protein 42 like-2-like isoform X4 n=1 Tax=Sitophilus oryzae TaxID=7048 RepID=A0A6J2X8P1_SITOR|nr:coiled-coil domain-containing protein 42 like-2-like isoform X4 [Sitophilus oryzae]